MNKRILFNNMVFSIEPEYWENQFMGPGIDIVYKLQDQLDNELFDFVDTSHHLPQTNKLFLYDEVWTSTRRKIREKQKYTLDNNQYNLKCSLNVIVDDRYPVQVIYEREFKRMTARRQMALTMGGYTIEFGRLPLVEIFGAIRYEPAIPFLKEIVLHDNSSKMRDGALHALSQMKSKNSFACLNSLLKEDSLSENTQFYMCYLLELQGSVHLVDGLEYLYERYNLDYPKENSYLHINYKNTFQNYIFNCCTNIHDVKAVRLIEKGINHPYSFVEEAAFNGIKKWLRNILFKIQSSQKIPSIPISEILRIIKNYDMSVFQASYDSLKKI